MATKQLSFYASGMSWTVDFTMSDISVSENQFEFRVPSDCPVVYAKYVCSGKSAAYIDTSFEIKTSSAMIYNGCWYHEDGAWSSGAQKQLVDRRIPSTKTLNTSDYFGVFNKTTKIAPMFLYFSEGGVDVGVGTNPEYPFDIQYYNEDEIILNDIARLILDAPPSATVADITKNTSGFYAGITTVSVNVSELIAYYGGDFTTTTEHSAGVKFEIGSQLDERHDNGTLSIALANAGTFTPKVTVTDSRGQTLVREFDPITVQLYNPTTSITTLLRVNATGEPEEDPKPGRFSDQGTNAVAACVFDYPTIENNYMKPPLVKIDGQSPTNAVDWYTSWTESGGFSGQVTFSNYNPTRPVTLYGKITDTLETNQSYEISVACDTTLDSGSTDSQVLPQAFYLISGGAGGHSLGVGMKPPIDPVTDKPVDGMHVGMEEVYHKKEDQEDTDKVWSANNGQEEVVALYWNGNLDIASGANYKINGKDITNIMLDYFYPVGSYYETSNVNFNPNTDWGGTWDKLDDGLFLQSTHTASKVGTNVSAGLPNITGGGNTCAYGENRGFTVSRWGAFTTGGTYNFKSGFSSYWQTNYLGLQFDASQSNSIYGNSTTVQPPSKLVYIWHRTA